MSPQRQSHEIYATHKIQEFAVLVNTLYVTFPKFNKYVIPVQREKLSNKKYRQKYHQALQDIKIS